jgi:hypothetical protein
MRNIQTFFLVFMMTGILAAGCSEKKRIEGAEVPTQPQSNEEVVVAPPPPMESEAVPPPPETPKEVPAPVVENLAQKYLVVTGDTLWDISGMKITYKDNFQWPLIFKANRDQIKDPDLIYPKQEFLIRKDWTDGDINKARKDASDTPKYVPHTQPRVTLPVDYF